MNEHPSPREAGRTAFDEHAWSRAYASLKAADEQSPLGPEDLMKLATAAALLAEDAVSAEAGARAYEAFLERGERVRAANAAFWVFFGMSEKPSQRSQAAGWLARAQRLVDEVNEPCAEQGWLLTAAARQRIIAGDVSGAYAAFDQAATLGTHYGDGDLVALARHGQGRCLLAMNRKTEGFALLDEVMVGITRGQVGPIVSGVVYCSVISACQALFDVGRAQEWTNALQRWCEANPDVMAFRGHCLVSRSELMQLHGAWRDAFEEARRACARLTAPPSQPEAGAAHYQVAELHRLHGRLDEAEEAYRLASQAGRKPYPGLALLRLAQGRPDAAAASIQTALQEMRDPRGRVRVLSAAVEIMLAAGDIASATAACDELTTIASQMDCGYLRAVTSHARGFVALASGEAVTALELLRSAWTEWQELDAPYELARVRVLAGMAYRRLGDIDGAQLEFDAAHEAFERLGAVKESERVAAFAAENEPGPAGGLTGREIEVLRLIATGASNRAIAGRLRISEKTVARHVSNIFTKLDLPSRAAATAYAYEHKLV